MMAVLECVLVICIALCPGETRVINGPVITRWDITQESTTTSICRDCTQIMELFTYMTPNPGAQDMMYETLHRLCQGLPGPKRSQCESQMKMHLPQVLQYLTSLKPGETCLFLGLCAVQTERGVSLQFTDSVFDKVVSSAVTDTVTNPEVQISPLCTFCVFLIKKLESILPKERTEDAVVKAMGDVCGLLPASYKDQCDDFIDKYGKQLVDFLLSYVAPHSICALLHLCLFEETPSVEVSLASDCDSCCTLVSLSRLYTGLNATEPQSSSFLQFVCVQHPYAIPKCDVFTKLYGFKLQKVLGNKMDVLETCQSADLCVAVKEQKALGEDHCTWGPSYRCKDMKTAQECGSLSFCQKFMWN